MTLDVRPLFADAAAVAERAASPISAAMKGSMILGIAAEIGERVAAGHTVANFTIGDFNPKIFPIPEPYSKAIRDQIEGGATNYPPSVGVPELRDAVRKAYKRDLGLDYPEGTVQVGAGARPPIYSAFRSILEKGDTVVYPVPTWNVGYYVQMNEAVGVPVVTKPENGFMPTADELRPHLGSARILLLNSPLNPCGTVIDETLLREVCDAVVAENQRREAEGERPLFLLYDQVYWQLTFGDAQHHTPPGLVPEMAKYTIMIDAISKCWAGTGLRVGWGVAPPYIRDRMKPLVGHMGAWAARAEQLATAEMLDDPSRLGDFMPTFKAQLQERLFALQDGFQAMKAQGLPVDCLDAQGAIYLSVKFDLIGKTVAGRSFGSDEDIRSFLLTEAGVGVVPFTAFGYPEGSGWVRFSVGSVTVEDVRAALARIEAALRG